jgi:hypothetical protein
MKRTTLTLPDDLSDLLQREAKRHRTSVSEVTRRALRAYFGLNGEKRRAIPFANLGASGYTDTSERAEEILAEEWVRFIEEDSGLARRS